MYYPKSQILESLYTNGDEYWVIATKEAYTGNYFRTSDGKIYTGKNTEDKPNNALGPIQKLSPSPISKEESEVKITQWTATYKWQQQQSGRSVGLPPQPPVQIVPQPKDTDYSNGVFNRYFLYNPITKNTMETNRKTYEQFIGQIKGVQYEKYDAIKLPWELKGNREQVFRANKNTTLLIEKRGSYWEFNKYFKEKYTQYYQFGINENLYTGGGELRYVKNKKPYIGFYHLHPGKGPMVGSQHVDTFHESLEFIPTGSRFNPLPVTPQSGSIAEPTEEIEVSLGGPISSGGGSSGGGGGY